MKNISFIVQYGSESNKFEVSDQFTLFELMSLLQNKFPHLQPDSMKLVFKGRTLHPDPPGITLEQAGVFSGAKLLLLASSKRDINIIKKSKDLPAVPSFEHEEKREYIRQSPPSTSSLPPKGQYCFNTFQSWSYPLLSPPSAQALQILHKCAADPGIVHLMNKYKWRVLKLSEMPPEGKVGVSPMCILGVNINKGQEISLRLRTDDLKGFRKYDKIKETLIHELAHMIYSEHDNDFKKFNSLLKKEAEAADWHSANKAKKIVGDGIGVEGHFVGAAPTFAGYKMSQPTSPSDVMRATAASSGKTLRELAGIETDNNKGVGVDGEYIYRDARGAAGAAAVRRASGGVQSYPVKDLTPSPPGTCLVEPPAETPPLPPKKGDSVLYRQKDGTWVPATIVSIDFSVIPPSIGIEMPSEREGEPPRYRETEMTRVKKKENLEKNVDEEYKEHFDPITKEKEDAVSLLE